MKKVKNIVLPIGTMLPVRKMMFASYLAKQFDSKIHLVATTNKYPAAGLDETLYLYKAYQLLKDNTNLQIECHAMNGINIADATLQYANKIKADLIVVDSEKESKLSGWINRFFSGFLFNESRIPVMTISPMRYM